MIVFKIHLYVTTISRCVTDQRKNLFKRCQIYRKEAHCSETDWLIVEFSCATFSFRDMFDFVMRSNTSRPTVCKIDHLSKNESRTRKENSWTKKSDSEHCASFLKIWPLLNKSLFLVGDTRICFRNANQ